MCGLLVVVCELLVVACMWDLVPRPGIEPGPPALGAQSLTHWTTRKVAHFFLFKFFFFFFLWWWHFFFFFPIYITILAVILALLKVINSTLDQVYVKLRKFYSFKKKVLLDDQFCFK